MISINQHMKILYLKHDSKYCEKQIEQVHINLGLNGLPYANDKSYSLVLLNNIFRWRSIINTFPKSKRRIRIVLYNLFIYATLLRCWDI